MNDKLKFQALSLKTESQKVENSYCATEENNNNFTT